GPHFLTGRVPIGGAWEGAVSLRCPEPLCRSFAADLFGRLAADVEDADVFDALGELANIIGGNLKALLPGVCRLGLPTAAVEEAPADAGHGHRAAFRCDGHVFVVLADLVPTPETAGHAGTDR